jgi:glycine hydroxymethyltransferase
MICNNIYIISSSYFYILFNIYTEGYPGARYYGGNENIDKVELLCQERALKAFHLDPAKWGVNVQSLSGSPANFQAYSAVLQPHDRIMSLDLPHGGHLSHGYQTDTKKISSVSVFFETFPYRLNEATGVIDYDRMEENAKLYRPKLIVAGASAYAKLIDYKRMRAICDMNNAYLLSDMAHIAGLVAAQVIPSPFDYSDIVTTTTHKSLRGPRGAMIFYRKGIRETGKKVAAGATPPAPVMYDLESRINFSVFPSMQGGPHNHTIAAIATCLKQAQSPEYKAYQQQVMKNAAKLADVLMHTYGYELVSGGTDNHLLLVHLKKSDVAGGLDGAKVERVLELVNMATNKNTVPGDVSAMTPGGIRMGAPALTSRGLTEDDFVKVAEFFHRAVQITKTIRDDTGGKMKEFRAATANATELFSKYPALGTLKQEVQTFARSFPTIGY